ncbi:PREDICTED: uncharacterized protein LOC104806735 [Tarenaya hassleriana]|uniref:uncharacterized protein LOC104806735 n=1 Tax=Tarenaya hassleriana TaxID=28532 RepID=UPI00053C2342|nr:PREDICTED: uncharacterized protein LOC104806735 [Tarenaya hassleriana]
MAYRYNSYDSRSSTTSSIHSDPSSSSEFKPNKPSSSRAIVKSKPSVLTTTAKAVKADNPGNITSMVKKLMEIKKSNPKNKIIIPSDAIAVDLKRTARETVGGRNGFGAFQRKLFGKTEKVKKEGKALTEAKGNTRTLAMVLRSERELLNTNKEHEIQVAELKLQLEEKNREVEKLKDLCLKQREEIKSLKSAILFPDVMNSQLQDLLERQGSELKQARQIIPNLQKQVTSLTGQLQCLAEDLAEVKANKYSSGACYQHSSNSLDHTSSYDRGETSDSLDFSSGGSENPGSPDGLSLEDLNPCLTPYAKTKSKGLEKTGYESPPEERYSGSGSSTVTTADENKLSSKSKKLSKSSDCSHAPKPMAKPTRWSEERKGSYRKPMSHRLF